MAKKKVDEKPKAKKIDEKLSTIELAKKEIIKKYGEVITMLNEQQEMEIETVSTGSIGLDAALGRGGMAYGRIYEVSGNAGSGKSTLAFSVIAEAQLQDKRCAIIDAEHAVDPVLVKAMGVDGDTCDHIKGLTGDANLDIAEKLIRTGSYGVVVIDSVTALIPEAEAEGEISDNFMGLLARLMSKSCRRFTPLANRTNTLLIFINQFRMEIGRFGDPRKTTGGEAIPFFATGRIAVEGGEYKNSRIIDPGTGLPIGHHMKFEVQKNKLAIPYRKATIPLIYGQGFDKHWEVANLATDLDILVKKGAWYSYNGQNVAQGELNMRDYLKENDELYQEIRAKVKEMVGLST